MKPALSRHILAKYSYTNFMKICPFGAKLFHAAGQTDRNDEANCHYSQFCKRT